MSDFKRSLAEVTIQGLQSSVLYKSKLRKDIENGEVFPAIRQDRIDFYHKGGNLFSYHRGFEINRKYVGAIMSNSSTVKENDLKAGVRPMEDFREGYEQIKELCSKYSKTEDLGISTIYHRFPFTKSSTRFMVLDIEIALRRENKQEEGNQIDLLLYDRATKLLRFYEAKHYSNTDIRATGVPKVVAQIKRYEKKLSEDAENITTQYRNYVDLANSLWNCDLPQPESVDPKVCLFIFGFDDDQKNGRLRQSISIDRKFRDIKLYALGHEGKLKIQNMWTEAKCR